MRIRLKPIAEQVVVITGASSGIGLATARMAAERGARVVAAARSEGALNQLVQEIAAGGGQAVAVVTDVSKPEEVQALAARAIEAFGGFDTWINDAGTGMYGRLEENALADSKQLFEVNFWGVVHGSLAALPHLKAHGGALINLGSEVSDRAVPLQGMYCASKHAIKGFTESLRMELEDEKAPVSLTLIKPGQIDTPFTTNAKNQLGSEPQHVPPVYAAGVVARAILHCAETPARDVFVGGGARIMAAAGHNAPGLTDKLMKTAVIPGTPSGRPARRSRNRSGLDVPTEALDEKGNYPGHVMRSSLYTEARLHPLLAGAALLGGVVLAGLMRGGSAHTKGHAEPSVSRVLHITLEAKPGREAEVEQLLQDIRAAVESERGTYPWYGLRRSRRVFEIFETFPSHAARAMHLAGRGGRMLLARSPALLARPPSIVPLEVLVSKPD